MRAVRNFLVGESAPKMGMALKARLAAAAVLRKRRRVGFMIQLFILAMDWINTRWTK
jgi:hypothetical protein